VFNHFITTTPVNYHAIKLIFTEITTNSWQNSVVAYSLVSLATWLRVGLVRVSPIAAVAQRHTSEAVARAWSLVAAARVPLIAYVHEGKLPLLLLGLLLLGSRLGLAGLRGRRCPALGSGPNEGLPVSRQLGCCQETAVVPPVVGIFTDYKI
jgi:hypothetical protein